MKELLATQPHSTSEQKSKIMKQLAEDWRKEKGETKEVTEKKKTGFDYSQIMADHPIEIKQILERQLKISKTVNYRDVNNIVPQPVWMFDTITQILRYGDEIVKDLGLHGKLIGTDIGRIDLR